MKRVLEFSRSSKVSASRSVQGDFLRCKDRLTFRDRIAEGSLRCGGWKHPHCDRHSLRSHSAWVITFSTYTLWLESFALNHLCRPQLFLASKLRW